MDIKKLILIFMMAFALAGCPEDGKRGKTGPKGAKGAQGEQGIQGEQGEVGPKGDPGEDGISASSTSVDFPSAGLVAAFGPVASVGIELLEEARVFAFASLNIFVDGDNDVRAACVISTDTDINNLGAQISRSSFDIIYGAIGQDQSRSLSLHGAKVLPAGIYTAYLLCNDSESNGIVSQQTLSLLAAAP